MENPAFSEWRDAREALRLAYDRAWKSINPYLDECISLSNRGELETLTFILDNFRNSWPWEKQLNTDSQEIIARRMVDCVRRAEFMQDDKARRRAVEASKDA